MTRHSRAICIGLAFLSMPVIAAAERFGWVAAGLLSGAVLGGAVVGILFSFYGKRPARKHVEHEFELFGQPIPPMPKTREEQVDHLEELYSERWGER